MTTVATTTVRNLDYNGSLTPGASTTFGFIAGGSGPVVAPTVSCAAM